MVTLDGSPLSLDDLVGVARQGAAVEVNEAARRRMEPARALVERLEAEADPVYGVNTGFGALADKVIPPEERGELQRAVLRSHAAGVGPPLPAEVVRGMLLLRARSLTAGHSGVRAELPAAICALLNAGITPWVPEHGSVGASGDLAPLAHAASVLVGEGWTGDGRGGRRAAADALAAAGIEPLTLGVKEGLALINGTEGMSAILGLAVHDAEALLVALDCACAMTVEALLGTPRAFDAEVVALRPAPGQQASAANLRALLEGSPIVASHRSSHHAVQDAYSLRCAPQVHGAARDVLGFCRETVEREMGSVVDNPVVLAGRGELLSAGNFHGQALAYAADLLASLAADTAAISERRINRLLDPARSRGLPPFLTPAAGLNSGLMMAQYTAASCVTQLRQAATPYAVQSLDTSAGQEDHVSMGFAAALRSRRSLDLLREVLAVEVVCAAQALELRAPLHPGPATGALLRSLRQRVAHLEADRPLAPDLEAAAEWLRSGEWRAAVEPVGVTLV
ncbi:MAG: histidine ammonia-lyase [Candidatus Dormibacteria bacterium]